MISAEKRKKFWLGQRLALKKRQKADQMEGDLMSKKTRPSLFERLKGSLEEAEKFAAGKLTLKTFTVPSPPPSYTSQRIMRIRKSLHMSQGVFAHVLNVSTKTVQSWEQGLREPTQAAQRLLEVLEKKPEIIAAL